jgi:hypothetical protein
MSPEDRAAHLPHFDDPTEYPSAGDVLDAVWLYEELAESADAAGDAGSAERFRLIADRARAQYRLRQSHQRSSGTRTR